MRGDGDLSSLAAYIRLQVFEGLLSFSWQAFNT